VVTDSTLRLLPDSLRLRGCGLCLTYGRPADPLMGRAHPLGIQGEDGLPGPHSSDSQSTSHASRRSPGCSRVAEAFDLERREVSPLPTTRNRHITGQVALLRSEYAVLLQLQAEAMR